MELGNYCHCNSDSCSYTSMSNILIKIYFLPGKVFHREPFVTKRSQDYSRRYMAESLIEILVRLLQACPLTSLLVAI